MLLFRPGKLFERIRGFARFFSAKIGIWQLFQPGSAHNWHSAFGGGTYIRCGVKVDINAVFPE